MHTLISAATSSGPSALTIIVVLIGALGGSAGLISLFTINQQRKKINADTDLTSANVGVVISNAALAQMQAAIEEVKRVSARNAENEKRIDELEAKDRKYAELVEKHKHWDDLMVIEVRRLGGNPTDPPPFFPIAT